MKKIMSAFLALVLVFGFSQNAFTKDSEKLDIMIQNTGNYLYKNIPNPTISSIGGEFVILALSRSSVDIPKSYFEKYYDEVLKELESCKGVLHNRKYTEYSRVILALSSLGKDPRNVGKYNLLTFLGDYEKTVWQGVNGSIWALIALDSNNYDIPKNPTSKINATRDMYIEHILEKQNEDGGWSLYGDISDCDVTSMALQALSKYQNDSKVNQSIQKALSFLSTIQEPDGGFLCNDIKNSESVSQIIIALCELGISVNDERFIKNGNTLFDNLCTFYDGENGFKHTKDGDINLMATQQGFCALVSLKRFEENKNSLYDMTDVTIEKDYKTFNDIANHKYKFEIEQLLKNGIINGKTKDTFDPDGFITRAEFACLIVKALSLGENGEIFFCDVSKNDWFYDYVKSAYFYGIIKGISEKHFAPDDLITREQALTMIERCILYFDIDTKLKDYEIYNIMSLFYDYKDVSSWGENAVAFCYKNEIIKDENVYIKPKEALTRAQMTSVVYNMLCFLKLV